MLLSPRWKKVAQDLLGNKTRTFLVVLSIAVGVFSVGSMSGSREIALLDLKTQYQLTNDRSMIVNAFPIDEGFVRSIRSMDGVAEAEGRSSALWPLYVGDRRRNAWIQVLGNFDTVYVNSWEHVAGLSKPGEREILMERSAATILDVDIGNTVTLELPDGKKRPLTIVGLVHDVNAPPVNFTNFALIYMSLDTWAWLGNPRAFNGMRVVVSEQGTDYNHVVAVGEQIKKRAQDNKLTWFGAGVQTRPGTHFGEDPLSAISLVLSVIGALALFLSAFLVINTINAVMAQQLRQIGIMKAVGANARQIAALYMALVLIYGLLGIFVGLPLGLLGAQGMARFIGNLLNFDILSLSPPPYVLWMQLAVGILIPMIVALGPVINGTRLPARIAIYNTGMESSTKHADHENARESLLSRMLRSTSLPLRPVLISLRNTFRRKLRMSLTLVTLTLASAMFIGIFSVRDSLNGALAESVQLLNHDVDMILSRSQTDATLVREALTLPGVVEAEAWSRENTRLIKPDGSEGMAIRVQAVPGDTELLCPRITSGRWINAGDTREVVLNNYVADQQPEIKLGDTITLKHGARNIQWEVVGFMQDAVASPVNSPNVIYANLAGFRSTLGKGRQAQELVVVTSDHDQATQQRVARALEEQFKRSNMPIASWTTIYDRTNEARSQFNTLITFLLIVAALLAVVGALGLMGTMSINVIERTREIGVMRAVGASNNAVRGVVIIESIIICLLSWAIGALFALPIMMALNRQVGPVLIRALPPDRYSWSGMGLWLFVVLAVALIASLLPAQRAANLTVREVLAYE